MKKNGGVCFLQMCFEDISTDHHTLQYLKKLTIQALDRTFMYSLTALNWPPIKSNSTKGDKDLAICPVNRLIEDKNEEFRREMNKYSYVFVKSERCKDVLCHLLDWNDSLFKTKIIVLDDN